MGLVIVPILLACLSLVFFSWVFSSGGPAWKNGRNRKGPVPITGPRGLPMFGSLFKLSHGLAHRTLASMASSLGATELMAFSLGSTPVVVTSNPHIAHEILSSPHFADRPLKQSAKSLMFTRAIGFAPNGTYWRLLRRIASAHLFSPKRIAAHEAGRQSDCAGMLKAIADEQSTKGFVNLRKHLQSAALNNIMGTVFGKRYNLDDDDDAVDEEAKELHDIVREGYDLLGAFNWSDHNPWMKYFYDPSHIHERCTALVPRVRNFVTPLIDEHRKRKIHQTRPSDDTADFVDVLLSLDGEEKLDEDDMIAVLWEMIFRGTDTVALLAEWAMAELILNSDVRAKVQQELDTVTGTEDTITDALVAKLPYLQAVVKETLRLHPPGPLLAWARLSTSDVQISNGMVVPANTTAMVNMWAITHDPILWKDPLTFKPERFVKAEGGIDVDVRGGDLRLAPFGAGRRACPGKTLGLVTVTLWVAKLVRHFKWVEDRANPVDLTELLKLSCEMKNPLRPVAIPRAA